MGLGEHKTPEGSWKRITSKCDLCDTKRMGLKITIPMRTPVLKYITVCLVCIKSLVIEAWKGRGKK